MYEGEPILAIAADSEELAAEAIERIIVEFEPLPFVIDPLESLRPGGPNGRTEGNVFAVAQHEDAQVDRRRHGDGRRRQVPERGRARRTLLLGRRHRGGLQGSRPHHRARSTSSRPRRTRRSSRGRRWPTGRTASATCTCSTQSLARTVASVAGWVGIKQDDLVLIGEYTGGGFGSKIPGAQTMAIPALMSKKLNGRPVMMRISREEETYIGRMRPGYQGWTKIGLQEGRPRHRDRHLHRRGERPVPPPGRQLDVGQPRLALLPGAQHAVPGHLGGHQHAAAHLAARAGRRAGPGDVRAADLRGRAQARHRPGGDPQDQRSRGAGPVRVAAAAAGGRARAGQPAAPEADERVRQGGARQGRRALQLGRAEEAERPARAAAR